MNSCNDCFDRAYARQLADLVRSHGCLARVVIGRKHGTVKIRVATRYDARKRTFSLLSPNEQDVHAWLGLVSK